LLGTASVHSAEESVAVAERLVTLFRSNQLFHLNSWGRLENRLLALIGADFAHGTFLVVDHQTTWVSRKTDSLDDSYNL
jgi:hypothetical protein